VSPTISTYPAASASRRTGSSLPSAIWRPARVRAPGGCSTYTPETVVPTLLEEQRVPGARWDLRPGGGNLPAFPRRGWLGCYERVLKSADASAHAYPPLVGDPGLRLELARY